MDRMFSAGITAEPLQKLIKFVEVAINGKDDTVDALLQGTLGVLEHAMVKLRAGHGGRLQLTSTALLEAARELISGRVVISGAFDAGMMLLEKALPTAEGIEKHIASQILNDAVPLYLTNKLKSAAMSEEERLNFERLDKLAGDLAVEASEAGIVESYRYAARHLLFRLKPRKPVNVTKGLDFLEKVVEAFKHPVDADILGREYLSLGEYDKASKHVAFAASKSMPFSMAAYGQMLLEGGGSLKRNIPDGLRLLQLVSDGKPDPRSAISQREHEVFKQLLKPDVLVMANSTLAHFYNRNLDPIKAREYMVKIAHMRS